MAKHAPERAGTSPAGGAAAIGQPCAPAQTSPVKWTGLPAELIRSPPWSATSDCHADHPRSSLQGRRIAGSPPGHRRGVGVEQYEQVVRGERCPPVAGGGEAHVAAVSEKASPRGKGCNGLGGAVFGPVVDDDQLVGVIQLWQQSRQRPRQYLAAVPGDDEDR